MQREVRPPTLLLAEHQVHDPAAANPAPADVRPRPAAVPQDVRVLAPGVLQRIRQDRHGGEVAGDGDIALRVTEEDVCSVECEITLLLRRKGPAIRKPFIGNAEKAEGVRVDRW